jgi:SAM-dependent methyltransferase
MRPEEDAYGQAMLDHLRGRDTWEIVERDDGFFMIGAGPELYFAPFEEWREAEKEAMSYVRGRVLDVGCGAGRAALHLQEQGFHVVAIDISPAAIETCRLRGVSDARVIAIDDVDSSLGIFDTILMLGGNLGLLGNQERGRRILGTLADMTSSDALIIGASRDRTASTDPDIVDYFTKNLAEGRLSGQGRIRIRYRKFVTPWFDLLRMTIDELQGLLTGTGWRLQEAISSDDSLYVAVLDKDR